MDAWTQAIQASGEEAKEAIFAQQIELSDTLAHILKEVKVKRDTAYGKRWRYTRRNGSVVILRDVFEKIVHLITKYAKAMDVAVNAVPVYAGPSWAAIRILL